MATFIIPEKICKKCGGNKWYEKPYKYTYKNKEEFKITYVCYVCILKSQNQYHKNHPGSDKKYHSSIKGKETLKKAKRTQIAKLTDYYMKNQIIQAIWQMGISIKARDVTQEQIEMRRQSLLAFRELKQLKNGTY